MPPVGNSELSAVSVGEANELLNVLCVDDQSAGINEGRSDDHACCCVVSGESVLCAVLVVVAEVNTIVYLCVMLTSNGRVDVTGLDILQSSCVTVDGVIVNLIGQA